MEVLNSAYKTTIATLQDVNKRGLCLWVLHADKIPPHIGISKDGLFYSLKVTGKDENVSVEALVNTITKKKIPTLCYELYDLNPDLKSVFSNYSFAIAESITCLAPIKDALACPHANKVSELIDHLEAESQIKVVGGTFLPDGFSGISSYEVGEIHARLKALGNVR